MLLRMEVHLAAKQERLYSAQEAASAMRLTLPSFRTKVSKLGIKGTKQGVKVFYTRKQLEDVHKGVPAKKTNKRKIKKTGSKRSSKVKKPTGTKRL